MSKAARLQAILDLVASREIRSQVELVESLAELGHVATQATVSRDVRELGLLKQPLESGGSRYVASDALDTPDRIAELKRACRRFLTGVDPGGEIVVLTTASGFANALAVVLDGARLDGVLATLAGDDTILVVLEPGADRQAVVDDFSRLMDDG